MKAAIEVKNLTKKYGNKAVVKGMTLTIQQGELFALLGVNGAGKTTLINMLTCLTKPTSGDATLLGASILDHPKQVKEWIAVSPQETAIAPHLSVKENLDLMAGVHGFHASERKQKVQRIMDLFGLNEVAKQRSKTLSGGWKRRLSIAMAFISEPHILFLDEPTLGLDILARRELWKVISQLKGKVTMILTTHYLEEAEALSDCICIMKEGEMKTIGSVEELKQKAQTDRFEDAFVKLVEEGDSNENAGIC